MIDDGNTYRGIEEITGWIEQSSKEFEYTSTRIGQAQPDEAHVVVQVRIDGTFPGGTATLRYQFELEGERIVYLTIEV